MEELREALVKLYAGCNDYATLFGMTDTIDKMYLEIRLERIDEISKGE